MLLLSERSILARASGRAEDELAAERLWRTKVSGIAAPAAGDGGWVSGELISLPNHNRFRALDQLEGFRPGRPSLYSRVLAPVWPDAGGAPVPAWTYVQNEPAGARLPDGRWPA